MTPNIWSFFNTMAKLAWATRAEAVHFAQVLFVLGQIEMFINNVALVMHVATIICDTFRQVTFLLDYNPIIVLSVNSFKFRLDPFISHYK